MPCADHPKKMERRPDATQRGYVYAWKRYSKAFLLTYPTCAVIGCGKPSKVTDHVIPHRGNMKIFWQPANHQPMCLSCHNRKSVGEGVNG